MIVASTSSARGLRRLLLRPPATPHTPLRRRPLCGLVARAATSPPWPAPTRPFATTAARLEANNPPRAAPEPVFASPQSPPPPPPPRRRRGLVYALVFLCIGASLGSVVRLAIAPPVPPAPGTPVDRELVAYFRQQGEALPIVRALTADPAWESWDAYGADGEDIGAGEAAPAPAPATTEGPPPSSGRRGSADARLTSGALAGVRGLPFQRVFWNRATGELTTVVYFGAGTAGWPGVVHGGALATVLDETLGRCAILRFPARTGVTARLELTYKAPTNTAAFYVLKTRPVAPDAADDLPAPDGSRRSDRKLWVEGQVETTDGHVCVTARALFVVPKGIKLQPLETRF